MAIATGLVALATLQIRTPLQAQASGLVAAYAFNEGAGTTTADSSGSANNGTITSATWTTAGKFGSALRFNGTSALVTVPNSSSLALTTRMTVEAWVMPAVAPSGWRTILHKNVDRFYLFAGSETNMPATGGTFTAGNQNTVGPSALAVNVWTHLAGTFDGTTVRLYVNGAQVASQPQTTPLTTSTGSLQIGGSGYGEYFDGWIDELRIYNVALTAAQIQTDMNTAIGGGAPGVPDLTVTKTHAGNFTQGQVGATYAIAATNSGTGPTVGTVTVSDTLPAGLTPTAATGSGWGPGTNACGVAGQTVTCTRSDALGAGASYPAITLTVTVASNAGASLTNTVSVVGGGETNTANNSASDPTTVTVPGVPDLTVSKTHAGNFTQGQVGATYTITATNSGTGPTAGT
ncbi:MAG: LamG-like jellyroll fold domain-containing protein, partial [Vicinamibacterales bacterium]